MFNFGEELIIGSYRVPWLVLIQLLITFLLLLSFFGIFALDLAASATTAASTSSAAASAAAVTKLEGKQSIKREITTSTSRRAARREERLEREASRKDVITHSPSYVQSHNTCYFLELAKHAFLKCLGLDSSSEDSSTSQH